MAQPPDREQERAARAARAATPDYKPGPLPAFRIFLNRKPNPKRLPEYDTLYELNRALERSDEFRNGPRAVKTRLGWPLAQVFVSKPARVLYCPIGKNACTFLKSEVTRTAGLPHTAYMLRDIHFITDHVRTGMQLSDYPQEEVDAMIADDSYLKFAVLRDPTDRLLSAYIEKFVIGRLSPANMHHTKSVVVPVQSTLGLSKADFDRGITFRQFVSFIAAADPRHLDPHWRPQALYLQGLQYDRLFRLDQLNEVIDMLSERSGVTLNRKARNVTGSGTGTPLPGAADMLPGDIAAAPRIAKASFLDDDILRGMETAFAVDYDLFDQTEG